jgi:uncharacterized protein (TIGR03435 family)
MKRLFAIAILALGATVAHAQQNIGGVWQGTLQAGGKELRIVFRITPADGSGYRAQGYSIDQGNQAIPVSVTVEGGAVRLGMVAIGASYEGRLSADGASMTGTFTQGASPTSLTLRRATPETAWPIPEAPVPPKPMAADADPSFEVATIKPSDPNRQGRAITVRGRTFATFNTTLNSLLSFAYGVHPRQIVGAPEWADSALFDIEARPAGEGQPNDRQWRSMLQKLLGDRFKLSFRREKREMPAYVIVVAPGGPKLARSGGDPNGLPGLFFKGLGVLPAINATIGDFAGLLQSVVLDRPVVDQTGLTGRWDFTLQWTPDETQFGGRGGQAQGQAGANAPPGLFTAMQEQLGLKMDSTRAPVDALVIDRIEKPTEN